jgi:cytochrome P450
MAPATHVPPQRPVPTMPGHWLTGNATAIQRDPLASMLRTMHEIGDVVSCRYYLARFSLVHHPDGVRHILQENHQNYSKDVFDYQMLRRFIGDGLLTADGPSWLRQRRMIQPAFHRQRIAAFGTVMADEAEKQATLWRDRARPDLPLDIATEMGALTLRVVGRTLFGTDLQEEVALIGQAFTRVNVQLTQELYHPIALVLNLPTRGTRALHDALRTLSQVVDDLIARRRADPTERDDLLSLLMQARDEADQTGMDDALLASEVVTLLIAGHETTANLLSWTWYLLSQHPEAEARLHAELASVLGGRAPTVGDLPNLPYTRMVIEESLRLYPPAYSFGRKALHDDVVCGYHLPKGAFVLVNPYTTHRHPAFWEDPDAFDPERFSLERSRDRPRFAYFPFGGGPRQCIGNDFALVEARIILATLAQHFRLRLVPGHAVEPEPLITLRPRGGVPMTIEAASG